MFPAACPHCQWQNFLWAPRTKLWHWLRGSGGAGAQGRKGRLLGTSLETSWRSDIKERCKAACEVSSRRPRTTGESLVRGPVPPTTQDPKPSKVGRSKRRTIQPPSPQRSAGTSDGRFNPQALKDRPGGTPGHLIPIAAPAYPAAAICRILGLPQSCLEAVSYTAQEKAELEGT